MSRIAELPIDEWNLEFRDLVQGSGIERETVQYRGNSIMAHAPHIGIANASFMRHAMEGRQLSRRLIELVRLRIAFHNQCRSCMAMRFQSAIDSGVTEDLVCSLEKPTEAPDLSDSEKSALEYADLFATNHFAINDESYDRLRVHFSEAEIVELGMLVAYFVGIGRFLASLDMVEELPKVFQDKSAKVAPWKSGGDVITVYDFKAQ